MRIFIVVKHTRYDHSILVSQQTNINYQTSLKLDALTSCTKINV